MSLLDGLTVTALVPSAADSPPWPHSGQEFEIYVAAMPDPESEEVGLELTLVNSEYHYPAEVANVLSDISGDSVTDECFSGDLPDTAGLWKLRIKFFVDAHTDWESGHREDNYGFEILNKEKV
jgi:hypothetical protein